MKKIIILILFLTPLITLASGMSVFPDKLTLDSAEPKTLTISNPSKDVLLFEVYADEFEDLIELLPQSFTLEAGAQKKVRMSLDPSSTAKKLPAYEANKTRKKEGGEVLSTNISITASPLNQADANVAIGTKIPLTIHLKTIGQPNVLHTLLYTLLSAIILFCLFFWHKIFELFKKLSG